MKAKYPKKLIVSLIEDDLIHHKLIDTLDEIHLNGNHYFLNLSSTIVHLMGFRGPQNEVIFEHYLNLQKQSKHVDNAESNAAFKKLARDIYKELKQQKPIGKY